MELYKYIDIINPKLYLTSIEKKSIKNDKWSWEILLDELNNNIIENENILKFKKHINKNIKMLDLYYKNMEYNKLENVHNENMMLFWQLQNKEIDRMILIEKHDYFLNFKVKMYDNINIMYNILSKLNVKNLNQKQRGIFIRMLKENETYYICIVKLLRKYYRVRNVTPSNDALLFMNIHEVNLDNIFVIKNAMEDNTKIYKNVKLPKKIIERVSNFNKLHIIRKLQKINKINKYANNIITYIKYNKYTINKIQYIIPKHYSLYVIKFNFNYYQNISINNDVFSRIIIKNKLILLIKRNINNIILWKEILSWTHRF